LHRHFRVVNRRELPACPPRATPSAGSRHTGLATMDVQHAVLRFLQAARQRLTLRNEGRRRVFEEELEAAAGDHERERLIKLAIVAWMDQTAAERVNLAGLYYAAAVDCPPGETRDALRAGWQEMAEAAAASSALITLPESWDLPG